MSNKLEKQYLVTITVDKQLAREMKNGQRDWEAYPNWDINYFGEEQRFISTILEELKDHSQYAGIYIDYREVQDNG